MKREVFAYKLDRRLRDSAARARALLLAAYWPGLSIDSSTRVYAGVRISCAPGGLINLNGTRLLQGVSLEVSENASITIGRSIIGRAVVISARESVEIGDGTGVADMSTVRDHDHVWDSETGSDRKTWLCSPIYIGDSAWLGAKVTVTRGVTIGDGAVIGAGGVVTKSTPPYSVSVGVPAKKIK